MYPKNAFITLTYSDEHLGDPKLQYRDFQLFMKKLRKTQNEPIGFFCTGEYGEKTQRKHWHAILFNYSPKDLELSRSNERGDKIYTSENLTSLWGKGKTEIGSVTFESAGYCARYAAKKLVHGYDDEHELHPISKKSNKQAIGKKWLEQNYQDVFTQGHIVLHDGTTTTIPRYYLKWFKDQKPAEYLTYVTQIKIEKESGASTRASTENREYQERRIARSLEGNFVPETTQLESKKEILKEKFKQLQANLKL